MNRVFLFLSISICLLISNCDDKAANALIQFNELRQAIRVSWPNDNTAVFFIPEKNKLAEQLSQAMQWKSDLQEIPSTMLPPELHAQRDSLLQICEQTINLLSKQQIHRWQASRYDVGPILQQLEREYPNQFIQALNQTPAYYKTAQSNLDSTDLDELNMAIRFNIATFRWLKELGKEPQLEEQAYQATLAVKDFIAYCNSLVFEYYDKGNE